MCSVQTNSCSLAQSAACAQQVPYVVRVCREQERIAKADAARRETERILREQQAEVDAKKAEMVKRDIQREKVTLAARPS